MCSDSRGPTRISGETEGHTRVQGYKGTRVKGTRVKRTRKFLIESEKCAYLRFE